MDENSVESAVLTSRIRGCLVGGAIGDALGAPVEFSTLEGLRRQYGPRGLEKLLCEGRDNTALITDDTQMTLFTMEGLIRFGVRFADRELGSEERMVHSAYLRWLDTQRYRSPDDARPSAHHDGWLIGQRWLYHRRAPGEACLSGLEYHLTEFAAWGHPGMVNPQSKGCGTVMRSAPFGLYATTLQRAFELAARCAQYTHGHPTGYLAAGALSAIIFQLVRGVSLPKAALLTVDLLAGYQGHHETSAALWTALALAEQGEPTAEKVESLGGGWVAEEALAIAVYCAAVEQPPSRSRLVGFADYPGLSPVQQALLLAVNHSGDSDSTGAICGNLLGAAHGVEGLPGEWSVCLENRDVLNAIVDDFALFIREGRTLGLAVEQWQERYPGH